jgi:hypothetical protein
LWATRSCSEVASGPLLILDPPSWRPAHPRRRPAPLQKSHRSVSRHGCSTPLPGWRHVPRPSSPSSTNSRQPPHVCDAVDALRASPDPISAWNKSSSGDAPPRAGALSTPNGRLPRPRPAAGSPPGPSARGSATNRRGRRAASSPAPSSQPGSGSERRCCRRSALRVCRRPNASTLTQVRRRCQAAVVAVRPAPLSRLLPPYRASRPTAAP